MPTSVHPGSSLEEAARLRRFWHDNYEQLLRQYPEQFVAVTRSGEVAAADGDLVQLVEQLRESGMDPQADVAIEFITAQGDSLLL